MTTSTSSAAETGLPLLPAFLDTNMPRRGFLSRLAALPLVGGSVALLGRPMAVAEPVTPDLIEAYKTWLGMELHSLTWQMSGDPVFIERYGHHLRKSDDRPGLQDAISRLTVFVGESHSFHFGPKDQKPYSRAALVLSTVGCDWREPELEALQGRA